MNLVTMESPMIREAVPEFVFVEGHDFDETGLIEAMVRYNLMALTAPEVGIKANVFSIGNPKAPGTIVLLYNCRILFTTLAASKMEENIPIFNKKLNVKRPDGLKARFQDKTGQTHTNEFGGLTARLIHRCVHQLEGQNAWLTAPRTERLRASGFIMSADEPREAKWD
jgi:peptide deformylase